MTGSSAPRLANEIGVNNNEAGTASQNGLTVAYVPIAMEAVAVPFIVIQPGGCTGTEGTIARPLRLHAAGDDEHVPHDAGDGVSRGSPRTGTPPPYRPTTAGTGFSSILSSEIQGPFPANLIDADASNGALTNYFLATGAQAAWDSWARVLRGASQHNALLLAKKGPAVGREPVPGIGHGPRHGPAQPSVARVANVMGDWAAGYNISAVPWSWTFPAYTAYPNANLPDVSVENAAGGFVEPNLASMEAAFSYASFDTMSDLVNFATSATDTTAYPAQMMTTDYLEVPLNGLPADKASTLAGFIDYLLSARAKVPSARPVTYRSCRAASTSRLLAPERFGDSGGCFLSDPDRRRCRHRRTRGRGDGADHDDARRRVVRSPRLPTCHCCRWSGRVYWVAGWSPPPGTEGASH